MKMKSLRLTAVALFVLLIGACATSNVDTSQQEEAKQKLLGMGAAFGEIDFIKAAANGKLEAVKLYLQAEMNINVSVDETALLAAVLRKKDNVAKYLIEQGADINKGNYLGTPLTAAARSGRYDMVKLLLDHGADVNVVTGNYYTPLCFAARYGHPKVIDLLVERGADANYVMPVTGDTPLVLAAYYGQLEGCKALIKNGANINYSDFNGMSVIDWAFIKINANVVAYLIEAGANVGMKPNNTVPKVMLEALGHQNKKLIKLLAEKGVSVNGLAFGKMPILAWCAKNNLPLAAEYLVELGADINTKTPEGATALDFAIENNEYKLAKILDPSIDVSKLPRKTVDPNLQKANKLVNSMIEGQYYTAQPESSKAQAEPFGIQPLAPVSGYGKERTSKSEMPKSGKEGTYKNTVEPDSKSAQNLMGQGASMYNVNTSDYGDIDKQLNEDMKSIDSSLNSSLNSNNLINQPATQGSSQEQTPKKGTINPNNLSPEEVPGGQQSDVMKQTAPKTTDTVSPAGKTEKSSSVMGNYQKKRESAFHDQFYPDRKHDAPAVDEASAKQGLIDPNQIGAATPQSSPRQIKQIPADQK
ncbi:MAG TPA: ankyrin repeat domain-containing protein [Victivallales bacterium]|nr:ankyrin repeat domain-containing protein [Victivallales bacterium]